ncbi:hypothetical protein ACHAPE_009551 [Trichoderma viride]
MSSGHLSQDEFFDKLGHLFNHRKSSDHGAIYLTQKRRKTSPPQPAQLGYNYHLALEFGSNLLSLSSNLVTYDPSEKSTTAKLFPDLLPDKPLPIIIKATNGKSKRDRSDKEKLSTVVQPHDLEAFYVRYADVCKAGMTLLKPRDKSKKKAKAKKKKATS